MRLRTTLAAGTVAALLGGLLGGCGGDPYAGYCEKVDDHREELTRVLGEGGSTAFVQALPILEDLREDAPDDIRADWNTIISAVQALQQALDAADVDPATYDPDDPPAGLDKADKAAITAAATRMESDATSRAALAVQQQVRDVCHEPLTF